MELQVDATLATLKELVKEVIESLETSARALREAPLNPVFIDGPEVDPAAALQTAISAAKMMRSHGTQLSMFMVTEPFSPYAIMRVLREIVARDASTLVVSTLTCAANRFTVVFRKEIAFCASLIIREMIDLVRRVPEDGDILTDAQKHGDGALPGGGERGSLVLTSLLWTTCDEYTRLCEAGVAALLVRKVEEYRDTLKDIVNELKEWGEETGDNDDDGEEESDANDHDQPEDDASSDMSDKASSTQALLDEMTLIKHIPEDDPIGLRPRLESCIKRLRLVTILYEAIIKRRIKTLPPLPTPVASPLVTVVNEVMLRLKTLPDDFEEVTLAFYELSPRKVDEGLKLCVANACKIASLLKHSWGDGKSDVFTNWSAKFVDQIVKLSPPT